MPARASGGAKQRLRETGGWAPIAGMLAIVLPLFARSHGWGGFHVNLSFAVQPILAMVAGLLILIRPKLLNFIVAAYLITIGIVGVLHLRW